jgi:predicted small secreted protein
MKRSKSLFAVLVLALAITYLTACGTTQNAVSDKSVAASTTKPAEAPMSKEVVLFTSSGFDKDVIKAFESKTVKAAGRSG